MADDTAIAAWTDAVRSAHDAGHTVGIAGGGSKRARAPRAAQAHACIDTTAYRGVVAYEPTELVITARAGTPLRELAALLASQGQHFAFEPPAFGADATLGGALACGYSGPARPWAGSLRDAVLGVRMINGLGEDLRFGGQVMKNVAGYDLARLQVGAYGRLGVIAEASVKVLPRPEAQTTVRLELDAATAAERLVALQRQATPLTASLYLDSDAGDAHSGALHLRFAGQADAVAQWCARVGGDAVPAHVARTLWHDVREHALPFHASGTALWRFHLPADVPDPDLPGRWCREWGGALRWLAAEGALDDARVHAAARAAGGYAWCWRPFVPPAPTSAVRAALESRIALAFDPRGVFAPPPHAVTS